jgi:short-subunit dehydrogenase
MGIGLSIAKMLVSLGAHVMLFARSEDSLKDAIIALEKIRISDDQKLLYRSLDITNNEKTLATMSEAVNSFGVPNALINCAGRAIPLKFEAITYAQFDDTLKVNLYGSRNTIAALLPHMKSKGGLIVNTSSIAGTIGVFGYTDYSASKFGLIGFSEALRSEVKQYNINVAVLCPPDTATPGFQNENMTKPEETRAISEGAKLMTSDQVAQILFKELPRKKFMIIPGASGKFSVVMKRLFPRLVNTIIDKQIKSVSKK